MAKSIVVIKFYDLRGDVLNDFPHLTVVLLKEMPAQFLDIQAAVSQGRKLDIDDAQPVKKVHAESTGSHQLPGGLVQRGDDLDVEIHGFQGAHTPHFFLLNHPEQFALERQGHGVDLIQENGAAIGLFKKPARSTAPV